MVVYHYRYPPSLLPTLRDVLRCENVYQRNGRGDQLLNDRELCAMVEADLKALEVANRKTSDEEVMDVDGEVVASKEEPAIEVDTPNEAKESPAPSSKDTDDAATRVKTDAKLTEPASVQPPIKTDPEMKKVDAELGNLDASLIKMLAFQRLQEILHDNPDLVYEYQRQSTAMAMRDALERPTKRSMPLPSQLLTRDDIERIAREFTSPSTSSGVDETAAPAPRFYDSPLMARKRAKLDEMYNSNGFDELRSDAEKVHEITLRLEAPIRESKIRARAVLVPVSDVLAGKR